MTTLLTVGNSEGEQRCDARCYNARGGKCSCCCGGRNHGVGLNVALEQTQEIAEGWLEVAARRGDDEARRILVELHSPQLELMPGASS